LSSWIDLAVDTQTTFITPCKRMKFLTKIVIAVLIVTALVPLKMGLLCLFQPGQAAVFFNLAQLSADVEKLLAVLGCFILATAAFQVLAITWLIMGNSHGFSLSAVVGVISVGRGIMMCILLQNSSNLSFSAFPLVFGTLILTLTLIAGKQQKAA
jgi:hypothetical protein